MMFKNNYARVLIKTQRSYFAQHLPSNTWQVIYGSLYTH